MNASSRCLGIVTALAISAGLNTTILVAQEKPAPTPPTKTELSPVKVSQPVKVVPGQVEDAQKLSLTKDQSGLRPQGQPGVGTGGNTWFPVTTRDLGTFYGTGEAVGTFEFQNPTDTEVTWSNLTPSCQCASADIRIADRQYRLTNKPKRELLRVTKQAGKPDKTEVVQQIVIGPKESGVVETHLDMHNITGGKQASLDIHTTDPALPHAKLSFSATGAQLFVITPAEVNLNKMTWNETREFSVRVTSPSQEGWKILGMDDAGEAFDVSWEPLEAGPTNTSWDIKGKYGPVNSEVGGGGQLRFRTDVNGAATFTVRVMAFVQGPLEVKPGGFLTLGLIRKGTTMSKEIVFEPNDGTNLEATALEFEKMALSTEFVSATTRKDGNKLIVELQVSDKAPTGLVKGELVVQLNHPLVKDKRIMFNGFVR